MNPQWHTIIGATDADLHPHVSKSLVDFQVPAKSLIQQYRLATDVPTRAFLLRTLVGSNLESLSFGETTDVVDDLKRLCTERTSAPALRSAALALLKQLKVESVEIVSDTHDQLDSLDSSTRWRLTSHGLTMLQLRPKDPTSDAGTPAENSLYEFEISDCEVTVDQYRRFHQPQAQTDGTDLPIADVTYSDAARYCNWLSDKDGLPADQWCYQFATSTSTDNASDEQIFEVAVLKPNFLDCRGYRLPTVPEWRYACGENVGDLDASRVPVELSSRYAWSKENSLITTHPVCQHLPNRRGLFDTFGNVEEWCESYPTRSPNDANERQTSQQKVPRIVGGAYWLPKKHLDSRFARREKGDGFKSPALGFRVCRTIQSSNAHPSKSTFWNHVGEVALGE